MENKIIYNPYPLGKVPEHLQRPELKELKERGYKFDDARDIVEIFEKKVADFSGSKYCITTDSCTSAIELCFRYLLYKAEINTKYCKITIPENTYVSAFLAPKNLGFEVEFENIEWSGIYQFKGTRIWDGAVRWIKGMYVGENTLQCISFQIKKRIPIGKMGCIITDDEEAYKTLIMMRYDGRDLKTPYNHPEHIKVKGYHKYATPEDCARGIILMDEIKTEGDTGNNSMYPNVKEMIKNIF